MKTKLTLLTVLLVLSTNISAVIVNGTCGDNLTWQLNSQDSTLTISGFGEMTNYSNSSNNAPWSPYSSFIAFVSLPDGLISIGDYAFYQCGSLTSVTIGNSVKSIGDEAFRNCRSLTSIIIPNSVTSIGDGAFRECRSLTSIIIPNSVTSIGDGAFEDCSSLTSVTIGNSVTSIGNYAFWDCRSLTSIIIPNSVTSIGESAFSWCSSLTSVTISNSVKSIKYDAFHGCSNLTSITIPNSVTSIGGHAFDECGNLTSVTIPNSVKSIGDGAFRYCSGLTTIYNYAEMPQNISSDVFNGVGKSTCTLYVPDNSIELYQITNVWKDFINIKPISDIEEPEYPIYSGTCGANLTWQLNTQDSTLTISGFGEMTNYDSYYSSNAPWSPYSSYIAFVSLPDGLTSIGDWAFMGCSSLTSITIPNSVTSIRNGVFENCSSLTSVTIPNSITSIGGRAFERCSGLTSINIPNSVTSIGDEAFYGCSSLTSVTIPEGVITIGTSAFRDCELLENFNIPSTVTSFGGRGGTALYNTAIWNNSDNWEDGVLYLDKWLVKAETTMGFCAETYKVSKGTKGIGGSAFKDNNIREITIPNSVMYISEAAFYRCNSLTSIYNYAEIPQNIGSYVFYNVNKSTCTLYVPANSVNLYKNTDVWKDFNIKPISDIEEPEYPIYSGTCGDNLTWQLNTQDSTLTISGFGEMTNYSASSNAPWYQYREYIAFVSLPDGLTSIGNYAFYYCSSLTSINIPNSVTSIGVAAFRYCSSLTNITIPNSVTSIGDRVFQNCSNLTSVTIGNSVTSIGTMAFRYCSSLTNITIPNSVTSIGDSAFENCISLTSVTIGNSVISIGVEAFSDCSSLTSVTIGNSVTSIGKGAFYDCRSLTSVVWNAKNCPDFASSSNERPFSSAPDKITSFVFGEEVEHIPAHLCRYMSNLTSIVIPNSAKSIGDGAFRYCSGLTTIYNYAEMPQNISSDVFNGVGKSTCTLYVPDNSIELYQITNVWKDFINIKPISDIEEPDIEEPEYTEKDYNVYYENETGDIISQETLTFTIPAAPKIDGFTFLKWVVEEGDLDNGIYIQAVYTANNPIDGLDEVINPTNTTQKLIRNGNVYILHNNHTYHISGAVVK